MAASQFSFRNSSYHNSPIISQLPECSRLLSEYCFSVSSLQTVLSPPYLSLALTPLAYRMVPSNSSYLPSHIHSLCNQSTLGVLLCISHLCICQPLFKTAFIQSQFSGVACLVEYSSRSIALMFAKICGKNAVFKIGKKTFESL